MDEITVVIRCGEQFREHIEKEISKDPRQISIECPAEMSESSQVQYWIRFPGGEEEHVATTQVEDDGRASIYITETPPKPVVVLCPGCSRPFCGTDENSDEYDTIMTLASKWGLTVCQDLTGDGYDTNRCKCNPSNKSVIRFANDMATHPDFIFEHDKGNGWISGLPEGARAFLDEASK